MSIAKINAPASLEANNPGAVTGTAIGDKYALDVNILSTTAPITVSNFPATQPVSGPLTDAQLRATPVPVSVTGGGGDASASNQLLGNASLSNIDTKTPALGQALAAASTPVVLTAAQVTALTPVSAVTANAGTNLNTSALALDSTVAKDASLSTLNTSVNNLLKPVSTLAAVTSITNVVHVDDNGSSLTVDGAFFQPTQPVSLAVAPTTPVTGAFFQTTQPVSAAVLPLPTGAAAENNGNLQGIADLLTLLLAETRAVRLALTALACDGGKSRPTDFDPAYTSFDNGNFN